MAGVSESPVVILIPVHDDWVALERLLPTLEHALANRTGTTRILIVDDGSFEPPPASLCARLTRGLEAVEILRLRRNLGHQRAIAVGLCYCHDLMPNHTVVVMDGDGEDDPADVPRLLARMAEGGSRECVFAERRRRAEGWVFRTFYWLYRIAHRVLTGLSVRIGNFSALPWCRLHQLVTASDLWNHYAASVVKSRLPIVTIPTKRATRLAGKSRMNFVSLVSHGLSAISVFSERVGVRLLIASALLCSVLLALLGVALLVHLATPWAIPAWAASSVGVATVLLVQLFLISLVFVFMVLSGRESSSFLPSRDYSHFIDALVPLWPASHKQTGEKTIHVSRPPAVISLGTETAPQNGEADLAAFAALDQLLDENQWEKADALLQSLRGKTSNQDLTAMQERLRIREGERIEDLVARLEAARLANDADGVLEFYGRLTPIMPLDQLAEQQARVLPWLMALLMRRMRGGTVRADVAMLATKISDRFGTTVEGASLRASLPVLRRSAGLCPRCALPYKGIEDACPACLNGSASLSEADKPESGTPAEAVNEPGS
jgi:hypothetical protein